MTNADLVYINKRECESRGFVRSKYGICKLSFLERIYQKGRLEYVNSKFSSDERLRAAERLVCDYEKCHFSSMTSNWGYEKVDCTISSDKKIVVQSHYLTAVKHIPREFWPTVRQVCIENRLPQADKNLSARRRGELIYLQYCDLCRGLDRLIEYYRHFRLSF